MSRSGRRSSSSPKDKHALTLDELNPTPRPAKYDQYVTVTPEHSSPVKQFHFSKVSYECAVLISPGKIVRMCFVVLIMAILYDSAVLWDQLEIHCYNYFTISPVCFDIGMKPAAEAFLCWSCRPKS